MLYFLTVSSFFLENAIKNISWCATSETQNFYLIIFFWTFDLAKINCNVWNSCDILSFSLNFPRFLENRFSRQIIYSATSNTFQKNGLSQLINRWMGFLTMTAYSWSMTSITPVGFREKKVQFLRFNSLARLKRSNCGWFGWSCLFNKEIAPLFTYLLVFSFNISNLLEDK